MTCRPATQPIRNELPDGAYQVRWNVTFHDGHPVSGTSRFTVGAQAAAAADSNPLSTRVTPAGVTALYVVCAAAVAGLLLMIGLLARGVYRSR